MRRGGQVSGVVTLVMIFCALCLCVFAVLTYSAADREQTLSELTAGRIAAYYDADRQATEWFTSLWDVDAPEGETRLLQVPAGENQTLEVEAAMEGGEWKILRWQTVYSGGWQTEDTIELWGGF